MARKRIFCNIMLITWKKTAQRGATCLVFHPMLRADVYPLFHLQVNNYGE